jgi:hypothetical protein
MPVAGGAACSVVAVCSQHVCSGSARWARPDERPGSCTPRGPRAPEPRRARQATAYAAAAAEGRGAEALLQANSGGFMRAFDARAVGVLEEAIALGSVPQFSVASAAPVDLRGLSPCLAEARLQPHDAITRTL